MVQMSSIILADRLEGLFWNGDDDHLKKTSSTGRPLLFSLSVWQRGNWGETSRPRKSSGTQAWPESWPPTHGVIFALMKMTVWAMHVPSIISAQPLLWRQLFSTYLSHLWADLNAEKSPTHQSSSSAQTFWRVCGKAVLALSELSLWKPRGLPETVYLQGKPRLPGTDLGSS